MRRSERATRRLDYAKLHNDGVKEDLVLDSVEPESGSEYDTAVESNTEADLCSQFSSLLLLGEDLIPSEVTLELDDTQLAGRSEIHEYPETSTPTGSVLPVIVSEVLPLDPLADTMADVGQLEVEALTIAEDIDDFLEENPVEDVGPDAQDYDIAGRKVEELRTQFRTAHNKLKTLLGADPYNAQHGEKATKMLDTIKNYIKDLKKAKKESKQTEGAHDADCKSNKFTFLKKEFNLMADEVEKVFILNDDGWEAVTDQQLTKRKENIDDDLKTLSQMHNIIKDIMDVSTDEKELNEITKKYEKILSHKNLYSTKLYDEYKSRQIEERKAFDQTKLSIELPKFKGYGGVDIYTFQSDFEKLYLKSTPKEFQPDLLKNNFLENPALILVKDIKEMDNIWKTLKEA